MPAAWRRFLYLVLLLTVMGFISHGTQDLYPTFLQQQRQFAPNHVAETTMLSMVGAIIGGLVIGYCSDRFGRRRAMIGAAFGALLVVPLWIAAPTSALIVLGGFLMQFFVQGAWGVIPAHMNELSPAQPARLSSRLRLSDRHGLRRHRAVHRNGDGRALLLRAVDGVSVTVSVFRSGGRAPSQPQHSSIFFGG